MGRLKAASVLVGTTLAVTAAPEVGAASSSSIDTFDGNASTMPARKVRKKKRPGGAQAVPELSASGAGAALTLLVGGAAAITGRKKRRRKLVPR